MFLCQHPMPVKQMTFFQPMHVACLFQLCSSGADVQIQAAMKLKKIYSFMTLEQTDSTQNLFQPVLEGLL